MSRYFIELAYVGTAYSGFQEQANTQATIQHILEKAMGIFYRQSICLHCSSRTDAGVHAYQNFFHFDSDKPIVHQDIYHLNALLPHDMVVKNFFQTAATASHARFDATSRTYVYLIHQTKNPFLQDRSYFFPFKMNNDLLHQSAKYIVGQTDFTHFSKKNTQVKTFHCHLQFCTWTFDVQAQTLRFQVKSNRFLRGMIRALVATQLQVARGVRTVEELSSLFTEHPLCATDFSAPACGLYLEEVAYPEGLLKPI